MSPAVVVWSPDRPFHVIYAHPHIAHPRKEGSGDQTRAVGVTRSCWVCDWSDGVVCAALPQTGNGVESFMLH